MKYQRVRGMQDLLPEDQPYWAHVEKACHDLAGRYGFERLEAPLLESTDLPIWRVAERCGVADAQRFNKMVRSLLGASPSAVRARVRGPVVDPDR